MELLNIDPHYIVCDNPFFLEPTKRHTGCQIDYLIQTRDRTLYLCEIKFSQNPISSEVIGEVEKKIKSLPLPRGYSIRPILIHVNGVSDQILAAEFFSAIIDFSQLLLPPNAA